MTEIIVGAIFGFIFAIGLACFITSVVLLKSNNLGDNTCSLERYTGYDPIVVENEGQVGAPGGEYAFMPGFGNLRY
ncbi:MAG: hypothetical protein IKO32_12240 [Lachnospiraceae bacterium]|nr:hypothetical protein [Lachnospiraceae bacterium]